MDDDTHIPYCIPMVITCFPSLSLSLCGCVQLEYELELTGEGHRQQQGGHYYDDGGYHHQSDSHDRA